MKNLKKKIPKIKIFNLEENHRSNNNIILAANKLINNNSNRIKKKYGLKKKMENL
ncbi:hypothetical protein SSAmo_0650 [Enterobacterales bacterium endosymbiont of Anomoneura mori]|uniref:hypothetical protein n=1 Tax=Enterobacterales bacterium endosymbiont of Anomoneura mori TaxID=3132096 RepID=UPI00399CF6C6